MNLKHVKLQTEVLSECETNLNQLLGKTWINKINKQNKTK